AQSLPQSCCYIPCNVAEEAARARLIEATLMRYGRLDVMVNNAGVAPLQRMDVLETTEESFDRVLGVNLKGTFFLCQRAARAMIEGLSQALPDYAPRIINISSVS
ncbi:MAG: SDR family oxidoreductase, partial [Clostridia bacterium]